MINPLQCDIFDSILQDEYEVIRKDNILNRLRYLSNWIAQDNDIDNTIFNEICNLENILHYDFLMNWDEIDSYTK